MKRPSKKQTIKLIRVIMLAVGLGSLFFVPWSIIGAWLAPLPDTVSQQVDDALELGFDGIIVYIDKPGQAPTNYAAGWKNKEHQIPADPKALFKIASISKLYVAAATVKLVQDGRLSLDDSLADHFPALVGQIEFADQITLRMMLQHRSGIPNHFNKKNWFLPPVDSDESLKRVLGKPADFKPDTRYRYSNTNFLLIGKIMDKALGYSHQRYIKTEILNPLGLSKTYGSMSSVETRDLVSGYWLGHDDDLKDANYVTPGGSMIATAEDVGNFLRALRNGSFFNDEEQEIYSSVYPYDHTGLLPGYQSIARYHEDIDTVVVQFVNTSGGDAWTLSQIVYNRIVKILRRNQGMIKEKPEENTVGFLSIPKGLYPRVRAEVLNVNRIPASWG